MDKVIRKWKISIVFILVASVIYDVVVSYYKNSDHCSIGPMNLLVLNTIHLRVDDFSKFRVGNALIMEVFTIILIIIVVSPARVKKHWDNDGVINFGICYSRVVMIVSLFGVTFDLLIFPALSFLCLSGH